MQNAQAFDPRPPPAHVIEEWKKVVALKRRRSLQRCRNGHAAEISQTPALLSCCDGALQPNWALLSRSFNCGTLIKVLAVLALLTRD